MIALTLEQIAKIVGGKTFGDSSKLFLRLLFLIREKQQKVAYF